MVKVIQSDGADFFENSMFYEIDKMQAANLEVEVQTNVGACGDGHVRPDKVFYALLIGREP